MQQCHSPYSWMDISCSPQRPSDDNRGNQYGPGEKFKIQATDMELIVIYDIPDDVDWVLFQ